MGHVHLVGICGVGMAGVAFLLKERGFKVSGCDLSPGHMAEWLTARGIDVFSQHDPGHIESDVEWVITSSAIPADCAEVSHARESGLPVFSRGLVLSQLLAGHRSVAVGGTHGKTTTTTFIAQLLRTAGRDPSWCIGGEVAGQSGMGVSNRGSGGVMVVEADESDGSIEFYKPDIAVVTNIEFDHMEHFDNNQAFEECFRTFIRNARQKIVFCLDDPKAVDLFRCQGEEDVRFISYGFSEGADVKGRDLRQTASSINFLVNYRGKELGRVHLPVTGAHNALNALAAATVALELGLSFDKIRKGLKHVILPADGLSGLSSKTTFL